MSYIDPAEKVVYLRPGKWVLWDNQRLQPGV
jgi:hypothetical protein